MSQVLFLFTTSEYVDHIFYGKIKKLLVFHVVIHKSMCTLNHVVNESTTIAPIPLTIIDKKNKKIIFRVAKDRMRYKLQSLP